MKINWWVLTHKPGNGVVMRFWSNHLQPTYSDAESARFRTAQEAREHALKHAWNFPELLDFVPRAWWPGRFTR